jgi:hypothetical protein
VNLFVAFLEDRALGLAAGGSLAVVAGSALPWIHISQPIIGTTVGYGLQEDGKVTILLGVLALALVVAYARLRQKDLAFGAAAAGLAAAGFAGYYISDLPRGAARTLARLLVPGDAPPLDPRQVAAVPARAGAGVFVVFAGAALLTAAVVAITVRGSGTNEPADRSSS